jgi:signal transduction histidine kinase/DNA-binding response OmpR family regulator
MHSLFNRLKRIRLAYAQILFIVIAFALMVFVSYTYGKGRESYHLRTTAEAMLTNAQAYIETYLQEPKATLAAVSETIRIMILQGGSFEEIHDYIHYISDSMIADETVLHYTTGVYGAFDHFGGRYIDGTGWIPQPGYDPAARPWYITAVEAGGEIGITDPYLAMAFNDITLTYARRIFDDDGVPLGVVSLDVTFDRIADFIVNTRLTHDGYSILLDQNLDVIAHPIPAFLGRNALLLNDGEAIVADMLSGGTFGTFEARSYDNVRSELVWKVFDNGWVLALMTPYDTYYQSIQDLMRYLSILGAVMAAVLSVVLLKVTASKVKSDEESRQKSNFLATVSHEIRTPLNAIIGITEIELLNDDLSPGLTEAFIRIYNSGYTLLGIINDLLDLSKIEAGKMEIVSARYEIASLLSDVVQYNLLRAGGRPLEFELLIDDQMPAVVTGDEIRIKQILNNVLSNAFKYTDSGKVTLDTSYEPGEDGTLDLVFRISDTGHGMTSEQIGMLFDEYSRFLQQTARGTVGTGLGMSITKRLLDLMDGTITVQSEPGKGSVFTVKIPHKDTGSGAIGREAAGKLREFRTELKTPALKESFSREYMPYGSVLIVDDMESNIFVAKGLLLPYGLAIDTAVSGPEAVTKVKSGRIYDVILMDHMMPGMDGIEAAQKIREQGYKNPIVALTANAMQGQAEMFLARGFDDFVSKPIDIRQLNLTLNRLVRDRHPPDVVEAARRQKRNAVKLPAATYANELAKLFAKDAGNTADTLEAILNRWDAPRDDDLTLYTINVHSMKSALANIGESNLSATALRLEQAARERRLDVMKNETPAFIGHLRAVIEKVRPEEEDYHVELTGDDRIFLREKWLAIQNACHSYDKNAAKLALNALKQKPLPRMIKETIDTVFEHLLHSDFEEAAAIAEREAGNI